jgi:hypothetical protein
MILGGCIEVFAFDPRLAIRGRRSMVSAIRNSWGSHRSVAERCARWGADPLNLIRFAPAEESDE